MSAVVVVESSSRSTRHRRPLRRARRSRSIHRSFVRSFGRSSRRLDDGTTRRRAVDSLIHSSTAEVDSIKSETRGAFVTRARVVRHARRPRTGTNVVLLLVVVERERRLARRTRGGGGGGIGGVAVRRGQDNLGVDDGDVGGGAGDEAKGEKNGEKGWEGCEWGERGGGDDDGVVRASTRGGGDGDAGRARDEGARTRRRVRAESVRDVGEEIHRGFV